MPKLFSKKTSSLPVTESAKKARRAIDLHTKMFVIQEYESGKKVNEISRGLNLSHSTVSTILKHKAKVRSAVNACSPMCSTMITKQQTRLVPEMEKLLLVWIKDQLNERIPLARRTVQKKAKLLFDSVNERTGVEVGSREFKASNGWFMRFKKRHRLCNVLPSGEVTNRDVEGVLAFIDDHSETVENDGSHLEEQTFNVSGSELIWSNIAELVSNNPAAYGGNEELDVRREESMDLFKEPVEVRAGPFIQLSDHSCERVPDTVQVEREKDPIEVKVEECNVPEEKTFTTEGLSEGLSQLNKLLSHFGAMDANTERFSMVERMANELFRPYRELYEERRNQPVSPGLSVFDVKPFSFTLPISSSDPHLHTTNPW